MKCTKRKYKDKIAAMFALSQCRRQTAVGNRQERRVYYCLICGKWHLTSLKIKDYESKRINQSSQ